MRGYTVSGMKYCLIEPKNHKSRPDGPRPIVTAAVALITLAVILLSVSIISRANRFYGPGISAADSRGQDRSQFTELEHGGLGE